MTALFNADPAAPAAAGPRSHTIALPAGIRLLNSNQRPHHRVKAKLTADIRAAAINAVTEDRALMAALAAAKPGPLLQRAHIVGVLHPATRRRADPANWYPSFKAAIDGIVDAGVLDDDDHTHLLGPDMRLGSLVKGAQLVLHIRRLTDAQWTALAGCQWPHLPEVT